MHIHISTGDGIPIYQQIVNQVKYLVASRRLALGDEMPPIRKLAEQLVVNPNTVARAYRELEREGILTGRTGSGTRVSALESPLSERERERILTVRADALLAESRQMDVGLNRVIELIEKRDAHMNGSDERGEGGHE